jgi:hypothetical protein
MPEPVPSWSKNWTRWRRKSPPKNSQRRKNAPVLPRARFDRNKTRPSRASATTRISQTAGM